MPKVCSTVVRMGNNGRVAGDCYIHTDAQQMLGEYFSVYTYLCR